MISAGLLAKTFATIILTLYTACCERRHHIAMGRAGSINTAGASGHSCGHLYDQICK